MIFSEWLMLEANKININWNIVTHNDWTDPTTGKKHTYRLEYRPLIDLHSSDVPSFGSIRKMEFLMTSGKSPISIISISSDGRVLDGHARFFAAYKLLGINGVVPVQVSESK